MASTEITPGQRANGVLISAYVMGDAAEIAARLTAPADPLPDNYPLPEGRLTPARKAGYHEANRIHHERVSAQHIEHARRARGVALGLADLVESGPASVVASLRLLADTLGKIDGVA